MFKNKRKKQIREEIELKINDLQLYLENNYKDLAIQARKEAISVLEGYHDTKEIEDKYYLKYKAILDDYTKKMEHYNHQQFYKS